MEHKTLAITKLAITTHKDGIPNHIYAVFNDGRHLTLDYQRTWQQCFASISGNKRTGRSLEAEFRRHMPTYGMTADMTRVDWAKVCFAYRMEMTEEAQ